MVELKTFKVVRSITKTTTFRLQGVSPLAVHNFVDSKMGDERYKVSATETEDGLNVFIETECPACHAVNDIYLLPDEDVLVTDQCIYPCHNCHQPFLFPGKINSELCKPECEYRARCIALPEARVATIEMS